MLLLAVTAIAAYSLADARGDRGRRADARAVLVLVVASLAFWSAIALWLLARG
jgi:hypothetical protein